jgi:hypothetical protein
VVSGALRFGCAARGRGRHASARRLTRFGNGSRGWVRGPWPPWASHWSERPAAVRLVRYGLEIATATASGTLRGVADEEPDIAWSNRLFGRVFRVIVVMIAVASLGGTAIARARSGIKGSPQPELKQFVVGTASGPSDVTTDGFNGTLIIAYEVSTPNTDGAIEVCVLKRGARSCESRTTLSTVDGSSVFGSPSVTVESGGVVYVAMDECCNATDVLFMSTDGGRTFGAPVPIGPADAPNISVSETFGVTGFGVHMMWAEDDAGPNLDVEFADLGDPAAGQVVTAMTDPGADFFTAGLGSDAGGVIAAGSDSNDVTFASFAPARSTVFHPVGQFPGQQLIAVSGEAMVTQLTTGSQSLVLRLFNGTSFGPAHVVPVSGGGGPNWNTAAWTPGRTFIFTERNQDSYDLEMQSTVSGSSWTRRTDVGDAIKSNEFSTALDNIGSGLVVGTSGPVTVFPVLAAQPVSFKLSKRKVARGAGVTAKGVGTSPAAGRTVRLEQLERGRWQNIATTHERANGRFSFHITRHAAGRYTFRAYVADLPGYLQYGYSRGRTLRVA